MDTTENSGRLIASTLARFTGAFGRAPEAAAYAPGRIEVLGNHTDYNEGLVLSAAIDLGIAFAAARRPDRLCRIVSGNMGRETSFGLDGIAPSTAEPWSNYSRGVLAGLAAIAPIPSGFDAVVMGDIPTGSGLSSSAALEVCTGLALAGLYDIAVDRLQMARICQAAEHGFAGVKCGLLDQVSSLFGAPGCLVSTDFRTLEVRTKPLGADACFLMCDTLEKHALVDGEYNQRRAACEAAAAAFAKILPHPVTALRDVSWEEWQAHHAEIDPMAARRAAHPIGETRRVADGIRMLEAGDLVGFGRLMFESHASSRDYFENSSRKLDIAVDAARKIPGILGARLSGGGFGGSAVMLVQPRSAATAMAALASAFRHEAGHDCEVRIVRPGPGASLVDIPAG
ncbi:MAG: galactokinase [Kiritimatiellia bacterium]|jgi:galactokinase